MGYYTICATTLNIKFNVLLKTLHKSNYFSCDYKISFVVIFVHVCACPYGLTIKFQNIVAIFGVSVHGDVGRYAETGMECLKLGKTIHR